MTGISSDAKSTQGAEIFINTVGTVGVASESYYWSRVAAAIGRLSLYLVGDRAQTWHMLVADDYHLEAGGEFSSLRVFHPLRDGWRATFPGKRQLGGDLVSWVGVDLPWVFEKKGQASLVISTLEALAVLISIKLFHGEIPAPHRSRVLVAPTWTDNHGNGAALNKLLTTRFPASAVLMELAACKKKMLMKVQVEWSTRSGNVEADALANGHNHAFDHYGFTLTLARSCGKSCHKLLKQVGQLIWHIVKPNSRDRFLTGASD